MCLGQKQAIWRCRDCMSPPTLCRSCMRNSHLTNPFHRIECWIGTFFRRVHLWEVGVYILVPHHSTVQACATLRFQISALEQIPVLYTAPPHSSWIPQIPVDSLWIPCGIHRESSPNVTKCNVLHFFVTHSLWIPCGIHVESTRNPHES